MATDEEIKTLEAAVFGDERTRLEGLVSEVDRLNKRLLSTQIMTVIVGITALLNTVATYILIQQMLIWSR